MFTGIINAIYFYKILDGPLVLFIAQCLQMGIVSKWTMIQKTKARTLRNTLKNTT